MKTFLFVASVCLFSFQSVAADEVLWAGNVYRVETIRPVQVDAFGRIVPMPPMTILVPVKVSSDQARQSDRETTNSTTSRSPQAKTTLKRVANRETAVSDVRRSLFEPSTKASVSKTSVTTSRGSHQDMASVERPRSSTVFRDSRTLQRRVY